MKPVVSLSRKASKNWQSAGIELTTEVPDGYTVRQVYDLLEWMAVSALNRTFVEPDRFRDLYRACFMSEIETWDMTVPKLEKA